MKLLGLGLLLTAGVAVLLWLRWDWEAAIAGAAFGLLATLIHVAAVAALRRAWNAPLKELAKGWAIGVALRLGGGLLSGWLRCCSEVTCFLRCPRRSGFWRY